MFNWMLRTLRECARRQAEERAWKMDKTDVRVLFLNLVLDATRKKGLSSTASSPDQLRKLIDFTVEFLENLQELVDEGLEYAKAEQAKIK